LGREEAVEKRAIGEKRVIGEKEQEKKGAKRPALSSQYKFRQLFIQHGFRV